MKPETYDYIVKNALERALNDVVAYVGDLGKEYNLSYDRDYDEKVARIYQEYDKIRRMVRSRYFDVGENDQNLIDIHKVCSCITGAIIKVKFFEYDYDPKKDVLPEKIFLSNYAFAILTSIHILYLVTIHDWKKNNMSKYVEELERRSEYIFPKTNPGHDTYILGRIKSLALSDMYEGKYDILAYADMYYWIEKYNKEDVICQVENNLVSEKTD